MTNVNTKNPVKMLMLTLQGFIVFNVIGALTLFLSMTVAEGIFNNNSDDMPIAMTLFLSGSFLTLFISKRIWNFSNTKKLSDVLSMTALICGVIIAAEYYLISDIDEIKKLKDPYILFQSASLLITLLLQYYRYSKR
ncbi:hypothetical protein [Photobacterium sp. R1]